MGARIALNPRNFFLRNAAVNFLGRTSPKTLKRGVFQKRLPPRDSFGPEPKAWSRPSSAPAAIPGGLRDTLPTRRPFPKRIDPPGGRLPRTPYGPLDENSAGSHTASPPSPLSPTTDICSREGGGCLDGGEGTESQTDSNAKAIFQSGAGHNEGPPGPGIPADYHRGDLPLISHFSREKKNGLSEKDSLLARTASILRRPKARGSRATFASDADASVDHFEDSAATETTAPPRRRLRAS